VEADVPNRRMIFTVSGRTPEPGDRQPAGRKTTK
jgi:hypothetical protein